MSNTLISWALVAFYAVFNSLGAMLIKHRLTKMGPVSFDSWIATSTYFLKVFASPEVILGLGLIFGSALVWIGALSRLDLSLAYPAGVGLNFLFVLICAFTLFGESLTPSKIIAAVLILVSLYLLYRD